MLNQILTLASIASTASIVRAVAIDSAFLENDFSKIGSQEDIYQYLYGSAPHFSYPVNNSISLDIPETCELVQVHLYARHGERYPTAGSTADGINNIWYKFGNYTQQFNGSLAFLNENYQYPFANSSNYGLLTTPDNVANPYNPLLGSTTGTTEGLEFLELYSNILHKHENFTAWTSNSDRVHATAEYFIRALGDKFNVNLQTISEDASQGANTLTPINGCPNWNETATTAILAKYDQTFLTDISKRLNAENVGLNLTKTDALNMFNWCAFEINVRGYSDICDVFTKDELIKYGYYGDLMTYYDEFIGNPLAKAVGSVPVNATLALLNTPEDKLDQQVFLSFTHDTNLINYAAALGIFTDNAPITPESIDWTTDFHRSWLVPQGARIQTQKYNCKSPNNTSISYVRFIVNDVVKPLTNCSSGPGFSCSLPDYNKFVEDRFQDVDFYTQCGTSKVSNVTDLTFYWDYKTHDYNAPLEI
ncbi:similar to Saccharomyces cerevisiae YBR093C PHO5 Repressible acid phosphatase (1 of 3) that also mediates extracellular nucleotide-derived phosphate hydrolysis [Maudiozyma saulgeensis]|uniref:acid phosphatase n=1 Tax=Maudiozyma saulgeensis TaxID=1789683 RepID=A0A1X7R7K1_9SACH|nr:similar to Saccharomyces cerevisiae YBR093C PHO5 Repressible acid phosphatase (1 of 3) that also mediates extracellular nucleotide-derived phosphate hydrolysis [Kazachstania saulgeensis]